MMYIKDGVMSVDIEQIIQNIKNSYGDKYNESDYTEFREFSKTVKTKYKLVTLVSNYFDLDGQDAKDMVVGIW